MTNTRVTMRQTNQRKVAAPLGPPMDLKIVNTLVSSIERITTVLGTKEEANRTVSQRMNSGPFP